MRRYNVVYTDYLPAGRQADSTSVLLPELLPELLVPRVLGKRSSSSG
jgi:hypothetical protein